MRILYLSPWFPYPLDTGSRVRVYYLLQALSQQHSVSLLTLNPAGWAPAEPKAVQAWCERIHLVQQDPFKPNRWQQATRFLSLRPIVTKPIRDVQEVARRWHRETSFDIIISACTVMAAYGFALPNTVRVLEEHNSLTRWMQERYLKSELPLTRMMRWLSWRKSAVYESYLLPKFDLITMVSEPDAATTKQLVQKKPASVAVVPNGVDAATFQPDSRNKQSNTLVFSGSLSYDANYEAMNYFLHQVYPRICHQCPDVKLYITGSTEGVDLDNMPLDDSVVLTGFVEDIRSVISRATVAVVPILSGGGTRLKILEAMALGVPVVTTSKGAEGLEVVNGKQLMMADDAELFATQVVQLLSDNSLQQHLAEQARQLVENKYDWTVIGQQFVTLVENSYYQRHCHENLT